MEFEFDKEIDAMLRKARTSEIASADNPKSVIRDLKSLHIDADDISAFAENALPEKTKLLYVPHLADCPRCRTMLANVISLNSEADIKTAFSTVAAGEKTNAANVPWYRKLLIFPQLGYAMGGLVLIFGGLMIYLFVQNAARNSDSMIAKVTDKEQSVQQANYAVEPTPAGETADANANAAMPPGKAANAPVSNMTANTSATPSATAANSPNRERRETTEPDKDSIAAPAPPPTILSKQPLNDGAAPGSVVSQNKPSATPVDDKKKEAEKSVEAKTADRSTTVDDAFEGQMTRSAPAPKTAVRKANQSETRSVGGRNFTRKDGVWYDANYHGQATTNISRGSDDYKKLDAGLRSIVGSFTGTVVIVYQSKALRIQ